MSFVFKHPIRVYVEDTDAAGIVYHTNHIKYMERARSEAMRSCGFTKTTLDASHQIYFVIKDIFIDYKSPAFMDDLLDIHTKLDSLSKARLYFHQDIFRDETLIATAKLTVVCINKTYKPTNLPRDMALALVNGPS